MYTVNHYDIDKVQAKPTIITVWCLHFLIFEVYILCTFRIHFLEDYTWIFCILKTVLFVIQYQHFLHLFCCSCYRLKNALYAKFSSKKNSHCKKVWNSPKNGYFQAFTVQWLHIWYTLYVILEFMKIRLLMIQESSFCIVLFSEIYTIS